MKVIKYARIGYRRHVGFTSCCGLHVSNRGAVKRGQL